MIRYCLTEQYIRNSFEDEQSPFGIFSKAGASFIIIILYLITLFIIILLLLIIIILLILILMIRALVQTQICTGNAGLVHRKPSHP